MWENTGYAVPTENRFIADRVSEMTRDGFQMAGKRRRTNTGSDSEQRSIFMLSGVEDKLSIIFDELVCIRSSQEKSYRGILSFQNCFKSIGEKVSEVIKTTNRNTDMLKTLAYKSIDIEARSRRNNLIFWGLVENRNENCFALIRQFIKNELDLDSDRMYLARAHRLGSIRTGPGLRKRPIIVNFRDFCDTEAIMGNAHLLRGTPFSVDHDLPKEINAARKLLWNEVKSIKEKKPRAKCQIIYPAKLLVDGKLVRDELPDWNEVLKGSRLGDFSHTDEPRFRFDIQEPLSGMYSKEQDESDVEESFFVDAESVGAPDSASVSKPSGTLPVAQSEHVVEMDIAESVSPTVTCSSKDKNLPSVADSASHDNPLNNSRPQNPFFRPFNTEASVSESNNRTINKTSTNSCSTSEIPVRESRSTQRGNQRAKSKSSSKDKSGTKRGTSTGSSVNSKTKNNQATGKNSSPRDSTTGRSARNKETVDLPDHNSSSPRSNTSTVEPC